MNGSVTKNVALLIDPSKDKVVVSGKLIAQPEKLVYYILNKPVGVVSTASDPDGRKTVTSILPKDIRIYPVGRLDVDSQGLILLTNDGDVSYTLTHPKFEIDKTYHVLVLGAPTNTQLNKLQRGVKLKEGWTSNSVVSIAGHEGKNTWINITIHEGRNRQVRRMCAYVGLEVLKLQRIAMGPLTLGDLAEGKYRLLTKDEKDALLSLVNDKHV